MDPDKLQFILGLVVGLCLVAAVWLRWDLVDRVWGWLERRLRGGL